MKTKLDKERKRKNVEQWNLSSEFYIYEKQMELLYDLTLNQNESTIHKVLKKEIEKKIASYKQQDIEKKKYDPTKIIKY